MLDAFIDAGHNSLDTADVYGDRAAEDILRLWLMSRRGDVVITSDQRGEGLAPERIQRACDASLRRMGIDEIVLADPPVHDVRDGRTGHADGARTPPCGDWDSARSAIFRSLQPASYRRP